MSIERAEKLLEPGYVAKRKRCHALWRSELGRGGHGAAAKAGRVCGAQSFLRMVDCADLAKQADLAEEGEVIR
jgi:hypothetical protein